MVYGHDREFGVDQLHHHGIREIRRGDDHAVHAAVEAVLEVGGLPAADGAVDERDVITAVLRLAADPVEHGREKLMREAAVHGVDEEDADVVRAVGLERAGGGVGHVTHLIRHLQNTISCLLADILLAVQGLAHRGDRDIAGFGNILHGNHGCQLLT